MGKKNPYNLVLNNLDKYSLHIAFEMQMRVEKLNIVSFLSLKKEMCDLVRKNAQHGFHQNI